MVKVTSLLPDGSYFSRSYPDDFFDEALAMHLHGKLGTEIVAKLIDHDWSASPQIVDVIRDEGTPGAESLRLWC